MTKKRFRVNELGKYNYSEIGEYIDENHTDKPLRNDEICELLNELDEKWIAELNLRETYCLELQRVEQENKNLAEIHNREKDLLFQTIDGLLDRLHDTDIGVVLEESVSEMLEKWKEELSG